ncbi:gas vesicle protein V [Roseibium sp.]|uniref:gas vesicle protein V n=1 Tax=Roseibium sp. TaxID=1936156 RepID=UPI003D0D4B80
MPRLTKPSQYELSETQTLRDRRTKLSRRVRWRPGLLAEQAELKAVTNELLRRELSTPPKPTPLGDAGAVGGQAQGRLPYKD